MHRPSRGDFGFTLIELLVVIAIIAILAAFLFPVLRLAQESAKRASCSNQMGQIGKSLMMYADNYNGRAPYAGGWSFSNPPTGGVAQPTGPYFVGRALSRFAGNSEKIWVCPSTPYKTTDIHTWYLRYYYSQWIRSDTDVATPGNVACPDSQSMAGQPMSHPDFIGLSDSGKSWKNTPLTKIPLLWDRRYQTWDYMANKWTSKYDLIHKGGWNILFMDGHVIFHFQQNRSAFLPL